MSTGLLTTPHGCHEEVGGHTVVSAVVDMVARLDVKEAFGVSGGAMATLWGALSSSPLNVYHFRHESGGAFAAIEAGFAARRPVLLFTTTGPGLTNALTGIYAARDEGARLIVISPYTSAVSRGRFAIQETSTRTLPSVLYEGGHPFHFATVIDDPAQLPEVERALAAGFAHPGGFVAHLAIDTAVQRALVQPTVLEAAPTVLPQSAPRHEVQACIDALCDGPFAVWVGYGARDASAEVAMLARRMRAPVMCSPRGKGIFPEHDALFVGVTGLAGHASVMQYLDQHAPRRILVLGSRLGEPTSFWDRRFVRAEGFIHVDVDPDVACAAFPDASTLAVTGDIAATLRAVLAGMPARSDSPSVELPCPQLDVRPARHYGLVRPDVLMDAIQRCVVDSGDALVLSEAGNAFLWTTHRLRFAMPHRYRASTGFGSMGHAAAGVVGAALASGRPALAVVGDGALLMTNEINSAVKFGARAIWVVLNDGRYGMCAQGMETLGLSADAEIPQVDFAAFARSQGAPAIRVDHESQLDRAFAQALASGGPFVIDVRIDPACKAPASLRNASLAAAPSPQRPMTFPAA
jgi:thiamine pyrophosphate-dependent acetolactate synthase large subunit-like protein